MVTWPMPEKLSTKEKWEKARERLSAMAQELKGKSRAELEFLAEQEYREVLKVGDVSFQLGAWSKRHEDGRLSVIVEAWRERFLGMSQSSVLGFFLEQNGDISEMKEKDFWSHGY